MPRALIATLCDDVREEIGSKHSLMGIFNRFVISDFGNPVNPFWIFARLEFEQDGEYAVLIEFRSIEGQRIFHIDGTVNLQSDNISQTPPTGDLKFRVAGFRFPRHGSYELAIRCNDTPLIAVPVEVTVPARPYVQ